MTNAPTIKELKQSMLFILRADNSGPQKNVRKAAKSLKPLWNPHDLKVGDHFSSISYLKVDKIEGDTITVQNSLGGSWVIHKDLLVRDAWSADIYSQEVKTTMTELASILTQCQDTVFTVSFKKKLTSDDLMSSLATADLNKLEKIKDIQKLVTLGQDCVITGHLAGVETTLGRSLIYDLNSKNGYRQVDHRTINWIIYKNVKYSLGKGDKSQELPLKPLEGDKWNRSQIQVGQWFSATSYYNVKEIVDDKNVRVTEARDSHTNITLARDILETEMNSGLIYGQEQKISRTELVEKLLEAGESVFTVNFNKKVDEDHIKNTIAASAGKKFDLKKMSKDIMTGKETTMTCCFTNS